VLDAAVLLCCAVLLLCQQELSGDVFDMLSSMSDFSEFKALILSHKAGLSVGTLQPSVDESSSELRVVGSPLRSPLGSPSSNEEAFGRK
jgi:hypothetical protein